MNIVELYEKNYNRDVDSIPVLLTYQRKHSTF